MCCFLFRKGDVCQARLWQSVLYITLGVLVLFCYLGLSITFYIECAALNDDSLYPFQCGSKAMWSCMGWVPLFFFFIITGLTFFYYFKQSSRTTKAISSSDAWLILFVTIACCILFFIHICYLAYIAAELTDNAGCDPFNELTLKGVPAVDCNKARQLISALLFFSILLIIFVCCSLTILFALVNGRIATPVNYKTVTNISTENMDLDDVKDPTEIAERARNRMENLSAHKWGDRVVVRLSYDDKTACYGTVRWYGQVKSSEYATESTTTFPFLYGVHLDEKRGNCDGSIQGKHLRPFKCPLGFGIFVPLDHIQALPACDDPTKQNMHEENININGANVKIVRKQNENKKVKLRRSLNKGLLITRGQEPNHLFQGDLFFFLRKLHFSGVVNHSKIGMLNYSNKSEAVKTKSMISVIFPTTNECIYNYLPLLSAASEYDEIFNPELKNKNIRKIRHKNINMYDEKDKEENDDTIVNIWYINLHESWFVNSATIKAKGVSDYQSSQWVSQSEQRALDWYKLLGIAESDAVEHAKTRFEEAPLPLFLKQKENHNNNDDDDVKTSTSAHYVPLGMFHNQTNLRAHSKNKVAWLEGPPIPNILHKANMKIELRLKRLIHEAVYNMQHILPYLHSKQYKLDTDNKYGWFPMDWVFAEVDLSDNQLQNTFNFAFANYSPPFEDNMDVNSTSFNPYFFMKYPRIPLFVLSLRLPLKELKKYAVQVVNLKYGLHSPSPANIYSNVSISSMEDRRFKRQRQKYDAPAVPQPKVHENDDQQLSVSVEMELTQVANAMDLLNHSKHHTQRKKSDKKYECVGQSDVEEEEYESEDDEETESEEESEDETESEYEDELPYEEEDDYEEESETDSSEENVNYQRKSNDTDSGVLTRNKQSSSTSSSSSSSLANYRKSRRKASKNNNKYRH